MAEILAPDYRAVWVNHLDPNRTSITHGIFFIYMNKENKLEGKFSEYDKKICIGKISKFSDTGDEISFLKNYSNPQSNQLKRNIEYLGEKSNKWNLIEGVWRKEGDVFKKEHRFYLARNDEEFKDLKIFLGDLHFADFKSKMVNYEVRTPFIYS